MNQSRQITNAIDIVKNKQERYKATFVCTPNECYYIYKGDKIKPAHLDLMLPVVPLVNRIYL